MKDLKFSLGDAVWHKSDLARKMVITEISSNKNGSTITCTWMTSAGKKQEEKFSPAELMDSHDYADQNKWYFGGKRRNNYY